MAEQFSILGRGRSGRALAAAWGEQVELLPHTARPAGWVLLAVPDHAVASLVTFFEGRCVHLSGSLHLDAIPCAHPLTSFDGEAADWRGTPLALTGEVPVFIRQAFEFLGFLPFQLPPALKPLYHAAAVLSSAHAATLWLGAEKLLKDAGVILPGRGLMALAEATRHNIEQHGAAGKTGPFVRGDEATILRDAASLPLPWREIFLRLGELNSLK